MFYTVVEPRADRRTHFTRNPSHQQTCPWRIRKSSQKRSGADLIREKDGKLCVKVKGVDVFNPNTGEVLSDSADGIACWFIDTDYNEESFFVRHAYFLGANDPYKRVEDDAESRDRCRSLGDAPQRHLPALRQAEERANRREGDQSPGRRGDEGVSVYKAKRTMVLGTKSSSVRSPIRGPNCIGVCKKRRRQTQVYRRHPYRLFWPGGLTATMSRNELMAGDPGLGRSPRSGDLAERYRG